MSIQRIVSLTPSNTEILYALGLGEKVVGVTELCNYPPEARMKPKVGDSNINPEWVVALKPDLVVAHDLLNARVIPTLRRLGLRVLSANPNTFEKLFQFILQIGRTCGVGERANQLVRQLRARVDRVRQQAKRLRHHPRVLFLISVEPVWASGRGTFADEMIRLAGGGNPLAKTVQGFKAVSLEMVLTSAPEIVILAGGDPATILKNPRWQKLPAVQKQQVHGVAADIFLRESPRLVDALEQLAQIVQRYDGE